MIFSGLPSFATEIIFPFLLVFVLIFAVIKKSKLFPDSKGGVEILIAFAVAAISIAVPFTREFIVKLMPWLAVGLSVILVFLLLYSLVAGDMTNIPKWMKILFGVLSGIYVIAVVLWASGFWDNVVNFSIGGSNLFSNILLLAIVVGAVLFVIMKKK
jgi:hypothetical protein